MTTTPQAALLREAAQNALITLDGIASANPRDKADFETPDEWIAWAKSRARFAADALRAPVAQEVYAERILRQMLHESDQTQSMQVEPALTEEEIWFISSDGMRNAAGGIYQSSVIEFARAVEQAVIAKLQATQAEPVRARWYSLDALGMATLCSDEEDARQTAIENSIQWPNLAPHRAVQMAPVEPAQAVELPDEREAFEAWAKGHGFQRDELDRCRICIVGPEYYDPNTETTWKAWQARAALSARGDVAAGAFVPLTDGCWYWVSYEGLGRNYQAAAMYRTDVDCFYSYEFSGIPAREVTVHYSINGLEVMP